MFKVWIQTLNHWVNDFNINNTLNCKKSMAIVLVSLLAALDIFKRTFSKLKLPLSFTTLKRYFPAATDVPLVSFLVLLNSECFLSVFIVDYQHDFDRNFQRPLQSSLSPNKTLNVLSTTEILTGNIDLQRQFKVLVKSRLHLDL